MGEKYFGIIHRRTMATLRTLRGPWLNPLYKVVRELFHRLCVSKEASFEYTGLLYLFSSTKCQAGRWRVAGNRNRVVSSVQVLTGKTKDMFICVLDYDRIITSKTTAIAIEPGR